MSDVDFIPYTGQERRELYEKLKNYVEREMRSSDTPNLSIDSFNKVEFSLDNIMQVPMTGMVGSDFDTISRSLRRFKRGARVINGETATGAATYEAHIPAYHVQKKRSSNRRHSDDDEEEEEDESFYSSTQKTSAPTMSQIAMATAVLLFALVAMLMTVKESQWERMAFWSVLE